MTKSNVFSGMRPTGKLHLGHYSVLENWVKMQEEYNCFFGIVDWHALTTGFDNTAALQENIQSMALDWLSVGLDPEKSAIFIQSHVKEHAELHLLLSMITPISWLERVPTYKEQIYQFGLAGKDIAAYGFLGYPVLMASDILVYRATDVPVGEDQLPHLELAREIVRRFNHLYNTDVLVEPQAKLAKIKLLPGIDNRKMSKSYDNYIALNASTEDILDKVKQMVTDPGRIHKDDPGDPTKCTVYTYHTFYNQEEAAEVCANCKAGTTGCVACKKRLATKIDEFIEPIREKRAYYSEKPEEVKEILAAGAEKARKEASKTLALVKDAMNI